jgi:hypothetical protein
MQFGDMVRQIRVRGRLIRKIKAAGMRMVNCLSASSNALTNALHTFNAFPVK